MKKPIVKTAYIVSLLSLIGCKTLVVNSTDSAKPNIAIAPQSKTKDNTPLKMDHSISKKVSTPKKSSAITKYSPSPRKPVVTTLPPKTKFGDQTDKYGYNSNVISHWRNLQQLADYLQGVTYTSLSKEARGAI